MEHISDVLKLEIQWLAYLGILEGFLNRKVCLELQESLGENAEILDFGERILDDGVYDNFERLQELVDEAWDKAEGGDPPPRNPFAKPVKKAESETPADTPPGIVTSPVVQDTPAPTSEVTPAPVEEPRKPTISLRKAEPIDAAPNTPEEEAPAVDPKPASKSGKPVNDTASGFANIDPELLKEFNETVKQAASVPMDAIKPKPRKVKAAPAATAAPSGEAERATDASEQLSDKTPKISMQVADALPAFEQIEALSKQELRQFMVQLLLKAQKEGASDVHLSADARPFMRQNRAVVYLSQHVLTDKESRKLNTAMLSDLQKANFKKENDLDFALALDETHRYRVNLMVHKDGVEGTYRLVPSKIQTLEELGFENGDTIRKLLAYHNGLILVTGPVGAGKTVTLASLIDELNQQRQDHMIAVEAPIEIVQHSKACQLTQREVGPHTRTFHSALKGALRQDPDIIVIGEMRDLETIEMAISASETGHLVIGTMHTSDAANTLNRLLDVFPAAQQTQIRAMVSESLRGIVCQRLLPSTQGKVVMASELLLNNIAVANLIRENKTEGLVNVMETGLRDGMVLMDKSIMKLWEEKRISDDVALANLNNKAFKMQIRPQQQRMGGGTAASSSAAAPAKKKSFFGK